MRPGIEPWSPEPLANTPAIMPMSWFCSCSVQKKKNAFKSIFQKISSYTKVKVSEEDLFLVQ